MSATARLGLDALRERPCLFVYGTLTNDTLVGKSRRRPDRDGYDGNDWLLGLEEYARLYGQADHDMLIGADRDDVLVRDGPGFGS